MIRMMQPKCPCVHVRIDDGRSGMVFEMRMIVVAVGVDRESTITY